MSNFRHQLDDDIKVTYSVVNKDQHLKGHDLPLINALTIMDRNDVLLRQYKRNHTSIKVEMVANMTVHSMMRCIGLKTRR